jgi:hypothetical protein
VQVLVPWVMYSHRVGKLALLLSGHVYAHVYCCYTPCVPSSSDFIPPPTIWFLFSWLGALAVMPVYLTEHSVKERIVFFKTLLLGEFPIDGWCLLPPQRESCTPRRSESPRSRPTHLLQRLSMFVCLASKSMPARRRKGWKSICDRQLHIAHCTLHGASLSDICTSSTLVQCAVLGSTHMYMLGAMPEWRGLETRSFFL